MMNIMKNKLNMDVLRMVTGGTDTNSQPPFTPEDFKKAAENMLKQGETNPASNALDLLN